MDRLIRNKAVKKLLVRVLPFFLVALVIGIRNPSVLSRPEFWAEDLSDFFIGAITLGSASLVTPMAGYHFFIERVIAYFATFFPVYAAPFIYSSSCLVINAFALSYFSRSGFEWLVSSRGHRIFICLILTMGPGTSEVFLNFCNLPTPLTLLFILMLLEEPYFLSARKLICCMLLLLSAGHAFVFVPLVLLLYWHFRHRSYIWLLSGMILVAALNTISNGSANGAQGFAFENLRLIPVITVEQFISRLTLLPILGPRWSTSIMRLPSWLFWLVSMTLSVPLFSLLVQKWRVRSDQTSDRGYTSRESFRASVLITSYLCSISVLALVALVRRSSLVVLTRPLWSSLWEMRYSFLPGSVALLIWFVFLFDRALSRRHSSFARRAAWVGMILISLHAVIGYRKVYYRSDLEWPKQAAQIQEALNLRRAGELQQAVGMENIRAHPGWKISFEIPPS